MPARIDFLLPLGLGLVWLLVALLLNLHEVSQAGFVVALMVGLPLQLLGLLVSLGLRRWRMVRWFLLVAGMLVLASGVVAGWLPRVGYAG